MDFTGWTTDGLCGFQRRWIHSWSTHAALCAAAGQETDAISKTVAELEKQRAEIDKILFNAELPSLGVADLEKKRAALDERIAELNINKENIRKELPKFAKAISYSDANMLKNAVPNTTAQEQIMTFFGYKEYLA